MSTIFERRESEVRSYCRTFPAVFAQAEGPYLFDHEGRRYIDFFAGAGVLNYGHNHPRLKEKLIEYVTGDGIIHALDMSTVAKARFLESFEEVILNPRGLPYKVQFPGPTGTNAVESALKLARKVTGRQHVLAFTRGFHGMTLGSLAVTGNAFKRAGAGTSLPNTTTLPFDGYLGDGVDTLNVLAAYLEDTSSGLDHPAAAIVETVQAEGGVNVAGFEWLRQLAELLAKHGVLLIVDDIQVGCGRTGPFFSFEPAGITPDIVCLSKSISGYGLPLALVLLKPELDVWAPGEHNGTFRGHNLAFVTATEALGFWEDDSLSRSIAEKEELLAGHLAGLVTGYPEAEGRVRGRGLIYGIEFADPELAGEVSRQAFARGLIIETAGSQDEVLKFLPPLTTPKAVLQAGLDIVAESLAAALEECGVSEEHRHVA